MFPYQVTARLRVNYNRPDIKEITLTVRAPNRDAALLMTGYALRLELDPRTEGIMPESLSLSVRRIPRPA